MDRNAFYVLMVSAATDFIITAGTALTTAMVANGEASMPSHPVILVAVIGGAVSFARTVQQAVRKTR
jgi:hypothetical protein